MDSLIIKYKLYNQKFAPTFAQIKMSLPLQFSIRLISGSYRRGEQRAQASRK